MELHPQLTQHQSCCLDRPRSCPRLRLVASPGSLSHYQEAHELSAGDDLTFVFPLLFLSCQKMTLQSPLYPTTHSAFESLGDMVLISGTEPHLRPLGSCQGLGFVSSASRESCVLMLAHPTIWEMINIRYCLDPTIHEDVDFYLGLCYSWYWALYSHMCTSWLHPGDDKWKAKGTSFKDCLLDACCVLSTW